jgi:hypothetical protein
VGNFSQYIAATLLVALVSMERAFL